MNKGQCVTKYYRWIQKNGGYIWIQSSATIAINVKNASEKNIIWVNYVLRSEVDNVIMILWYNGMVEQSKKLPPFSYCFSLISVETLGGQGEFIKTHSKEVKEKLLKESRCLYTRLLNKCRCPENGEFYRDKNLCRLIKETKHIKLFFLIFSCLRVIQCNSFSCPCFPRPRKPKRGHLSLIPVDLT